MADQFIADDNSGDKEAGSFANPFGREKLNSI